MRRSHHVTRLSALLAFVPVLWSMPAAWAQDLQFGEEEELIFEEEELQYQGDEPGEEGETGEPASSQPFTTGFIVPSEYMSSSLAEDLSVVLMQQLASIQSIIAIPNDQLHEEFEVMGAELALECAFDPVCLGRVGDEVGLDQIVIGRVTESRQTGAIGFTMDLVDVASRSVLRYRFAETNNTFSAISSEIERQIPYLFALERERIEGPVAGPTGPSTLQVVASWTTLALGVASLGVAIYFGLDAASIEDEVRNGELRDGDIYMMTQVQAQERLDDAEGSALLSNIFLGTGVALLGVSVLLFLITPGSDIDVAAEQVSRLLPARPVLAPAVTGSGWGIMGRFEF